MSSLPEEDKKAKKTENSEKNKEHSKIAKKLKGILNEILEE
jgi:hypothetical protein